MYKKIWVNGYPKCPTCGGETRCTKRYREGKAIVAGLFECGKCGEINYYEKGKIT